VLLNNPNKRAKPGKGKIMKAVRDLRHIARRSITDENMKLICDRLNNTPRNCLGWKTPTEVFRE